MKRSELFSLGLVVLSVLTGAAFYPYVPAEMASHWDATGNVNGTMPRAWGVFLFPIIIAVILLILLIIPRIDPRRDNIARFRQYFDDFVYGFGFFLYYFYLLILFQNVGYQFNLTLFLVPAIAGLFYLIGILLPHTKLNFMIGIRTPWTISSEKVWNKTHEAGGPIFKWCALIALLAIVFQSATIWLLIIPVVAGTIGLVIYSYVLYERER